AVAVGAASLMAAPPSGSGTAGGSGRKAASAKLYTASATLSIHWEIFRQIDREQLADQAGFDIGREGLGGDHHADRFPGPRLLGKAHDEADQLRLAAFDQHHRSAAVAQADDAAGGKEQFALGHAVGVRRQQAAAVVGAQLVLGALAVARRIEARA